MNALKVTGNLMVHGDKPGGEAEPASVGFVALTDNGSAYSTTRGRGKFHGTRPIFMKHRPDAVRFCKGTAERPLNADELDGTEEYLRAGGYAVERAL